MIECAGSDAASRGILVSASSATTTIAPLLIFVLGTVTAWRNVSLYGAVVTIITVITLFMVSDRLKTETTTIVRGICLNVIRPLSIRFPSRPFG